MAILYSKLPDDIKKTIVTPYVSIENNEASKPLGFSHLGSAHDDGFDDPNLFDLTAKSNLN